jgi:hypothetical protein
MRSNGWPICGSKCTDSFTLVTPNRSFSKSSRLHHAARGSGGGASRKSRDEGLARAAIACSCRRRL